MVVYYCGSFIRYADIPHALWEDVDACIAVGDEIIVGNDGFGHKVYGRCKSRQYENASVYKTKPGCEKIPVNCDRMVAVWDGESHEVLVNILLLLALQKKCRLYYLPSDSCIEISSIDELEPLVPDREGWTPKFMRKVLKTCGFSKEMLEHILRRGRLSEYVMTDVVCRAPIPLKKKQELLDELIKRDNTNFKTFVKAAEAIKAGDYDAVREAVMDVFVRMDDSLYDAFNECTMVEMGLRHYTYYLFDEWYDPDVLIKKSHPCGMFGTFKQVKNYIKKEMEYEREEMGGEDEAYPSWYRIEAWNLGAWGKYEHAYNYYAYNGEVCWFERMKVCREKNGYEYYMPEEGRFCGGDIDLCMSSPFKAGDIVNIDCRPFGPPLHALVVQGWSQYECRFPLVLFKVPFTDTWRISVSYFKHFYKDANGYYYEPKLSPLYRLRSVGEDELTEEDELLVKVGKWIGGDEERGAALWKAWNEGTDEKTESEVIEVLERMNG